MHIARRTDTVLHAWDDEQAVLGTDGKALDAKDIDQYIELMWDDGVIADASKHSKKQSSSIPPEESLYDFFLHKASSLFQDEPHEIASRKRETFLEMASAWGAYVGSHVSRQSLRFLWLEECIEGENLFVAETYAKILEHVARPAREQAKVCLGSEVISIDSTGFTRPDSKSATGHLRKRLNQHGDRDSTERIKVTTAAGDTHWFDEVVITTPLGWLKRNADAFKPPLSPRLAQAVHNIGYGTLDKVYITFPSAFWETSTPADQNRETTSHKADPDSKTTNVTATRTALHQSSAASSAAHYPGFTHWLSPIYDPANNPHQWDQQGMNMAALPAKCAHPTILFYTYGECSKHIADLVSSMPAGEADAKLIKFFEPYYSRLRNYSIDNPACRPTAVIATAWANDKFAGYGSYSNFQIGLEKGDEDIEVMREGMPERRVWFAGEHTAPFVALGTSTGAYWSGEKVAQRIVEACRVDADNVKKADAT